MHRDEVRSILDNHRAERNEACPEIDIDLLVDFAETPTFSVYMKLRIFLEDLLDARIDLVAESSLRDCVRPDVENDVIPVGVFSPA